MQTIRVHQQGDADALSYEAIDTPQPVTDMVRVKIEAAGINFVDIYQRKGAYKMATPFTPGLEAGGIVDAVGESVTSLKVGDRVAYAQSLGAYAEYAIVPEQKIVQLPENIDMQTGSAIMLQGLTAHYLSYSTYPLGADDVALVHAAAGGVGLLLVQMAKQRGAYIIGTVSTEGKAELAKQAGADKVILYTETDFEDEVKQLTDGQGVNVVYDSVGQTTFDKSLNCLKPRGYLVLYGAASGPVPPFELQRLNSGGSLFVTRPSLGHYVLTRDELLQRVDEMFAMITKGNLKVRIDKTFPLADAADAHRYMEARLSKGKVLLIP